MSDAPVSYAQWKEVNLQVENFTRPADDGSNRLYNFWEATNGVGILDSNNLQNSLSTERELTITSPNDSEITVNQTYNIAWTTSLTGLVNVDLLKEGELVESIAANINATQGSIQWTATNLSLGSDHRIRVSNAADASVRDFTNQEASSLIAISSPLKLPL